MKYSIIIPVYKVEVYLRRCVNSVLSQTFTEYELILVDDGSPDKCPQICDEYADKYDCVKVVHKSNGGSSSARNAGLDIAKGEYILFVDSDDYWENNDVLNMLHDRITQYDEDVILFSCSILHVDGRRELTRGNYDLDIINKHDKRFTIEYLVKLNMLPGAAWIMATKRTLIEKLQLRFPVGVTAEDFVWILSILHGCKSIGAVDGNWYVYVKREGAITSQSSLSGIKGASLAIQMALDKGFCDDYPHLKSFLQRLELLSLMSYSPLLETEKSEAKVLIKNNLIVLSAWQRLVVLTFGLYATSCMMRFMYNLIRK